MSAPSAVPWVLRAGQCFDGEAFRGATDVVIADGRITAVTEPTAYAPGIAVRDLGEDTTLLPGLVDAHVHLTWDCSPDPIGWHRDHDDDALLARARDNARRALAAGITTMRDLGGRGRVTLDLRHECATEATAGPTLLVSGPPITTPGGHCWFLGGESHGIPQIEAEVRRQLGAGVDVVKVMATGGNITPGSAPHESQFGPAELARVVELAHAGGVPVAAHAHGAPGVRDGLAAGVDTIEHCSFMTAEGIADDPELIAALAASEVAVSLTAGHLPGGAPPPALASRLEALLSHMHRLVDEGVTWVVGTDAGIAPSKPHDVLPWAVPMILDLGGTDLETVLAGCTSRAARAVGMGDRAGSVALGRSADVLVTDGRVDRDVSALRRPLLVLRRGVDVGGRLAAGAASALSPAPASGGD